MIRVIHNLGGCGGTLLSRCLGVLPGVVLYGEIHPAAVKLYPHFDPVDQDRRWHGLLSKTEQDRFCGMDLRGPAAFGELLSTLHARVVQTGRHLVLRDWTYIDFVGLPFVAPSGRLTILEALPDGVPLRRVALFRDPVDQWVSLCKHTELTEVLTPERFAAAWSTFLQAVGDIPVYRYEAFSSHPQAELQSLCQDLELPFEPAFMERFSSFDSVTGDMTRLRDPSIQAPPRRPVPPHARAAFEPLLQGYGRSSWM